MPWLCSITDIVNPIVLQRKLEAGARRYQEQYSGTRSTASQAIDFSGSARYNEAKVKILPVEEDAKFKDNFVIGTMASGVAAPNSAKLERNSVYRPRNDSCILYTDGIGRLESVNGTLKLNGPNRYSKAAGDIARMFSAMNPDPTNASSRYNDFSSEAYFGLPQLKKEWTSALVAGKSVHISIDMNYSNLSPVPNCYNILYLIDDKVTEVRIYNSH